MNGAGRKVAQRRVGSLSMAVVCGMLLTGCGPSDEPEGPESTASTETDQVDEGSESGEVTDEAAEAEPDPEPEPVPASSEGPAENWPEPEVPDEVYQETGDGAIAMLEHWVETRNYLQLTGDDEPMWEISSEDCELCQNVTERMTGVYATGDHWYESEGSSIDSAYATNVLDGRAYVMFEFYEGRFVAYENGDELGQGGGSDFDLCEAALDYVDGRWLVQEINVIPPEG
ncbi:DUF6318 family protein [Nesterenkonia sp. CL21]|uniref:DUF6318 family protein n=1 Tax=Nesterenkonia sp. CL21 TaxID=3064894 RepID=UPI00287A43E0|nr:DUF6318 family protein [Nesterenkonia sp. CL21]MDS2171159.1 DUF6318 family protein [Nesterenkonia sp. CL21]